MAKVSVIIPVYNTEKYLRKCLESVCNQTLSDIEIICIDDCSTDGSLEILKEYSKKDERIKLVELKENKGAGAARNLGIDNAKGEYIGFVDSDDWIDLDFYEKLYKEAIRTDADITKGSDYVLRFQDGTTIVDKQNCKIKENKLNFWSQFTTAIYRKIFVLENKIFFPEDLLVGEDPVFAIKCAFLSNKISVIDDARYYYNRREDSLNSPIWSEKKIDDYIKYIKIVCDFASIQNVSKNDNITFFNRIIEDVIINKNDRAKNKKIEKKFEVLLKYVKSKRIKYPIRVLFDAFTFIWAHKSDGDRRGIYWVAHNLLKQFMNDDRFEVSLWMEYYCGEKIFKLIQSEYKIPIIFSKIVLGKNMKYKVVLNKNFNPSDYDISFNPNTGSHFIDDRYLTNFNVLHDTIPCLDNKWYPFDPGVEFFRFYRKLNKDSYCFCVSQSCKNDFIRFFYNLDPDKMFVAYNSTAQEFYPLYKKDKLEKVLKKLNVPDNAQRKYILYFGQVDDQRKNVLLNIKCFIDFIKKYNIDDLYFYLAGSGSDNLEESLQNKLGDEYKLYLKYVIKLGYIDDEDVNVLYSNSLFFSFLSSYEGFGMPPLEAMQAGTPVVCADNSSLPEVVGDAAILVDIEDEDAIIEAFRVFYFDKDKREEYIKKGLERAKMFSWENTYKTISSTIISKLKEN